MLQELINLTNKAKGTDYEMLFQQVYELTVEIEAVYTEKFPTNANKIIYFHERFTRAFVNTYALLMQNVEELTMLASVPITPIHGVSADDDLSNSTKSYTEQIAEQLADAVKNMQFIREQSKLVVDGRTYRRLPRRT